MPSSTGTVVFEDATLKAVELVAETMTLNNFSMSTATSLQQATNTGNVTTNTVEFTNPTTAFVTTGNVEVGGELTVSGNVEVGTANLFVDTVSGNVGIGTTNPSVDLDVVGEMKVSANVEVGTANLFVDTVSGNVGIGTTNPIAKLHVNGNFYAPGSVVQVNAVNTSSDFSTTTATNSGSATYPDTGIKLSITPKFSTSKILVNFNFLVYLANQVDGGANGVRINVKRKINGTSQTTVYGLAGVHNLHVYTKDPRSEHSFINISFIDSPNTTGTVEYEIAAMMYNTTGTLYVGNGNNQPITIILSEIAV